MRCCFEEILPAYNIWCEASGQNALLKRSLHLVSFVDSPLFAHIHTVNHILLWYHGLCSIVKWQWLTIHVKANKYQKLSNLLALTQFQSMNILYTDLVCLSHNSPQYSILNIWYKMLHWSGACCCGRGRQSSPSLPVRLELRVATRCCRRWKSNPSLSSWAAALLQCLSSHGHLSSVVCFALGVAEQTLGTSWTEL